MSQIQFFERVVDFPVVRQLRAPTVQQTVEILQVPVLGLVLDSHLLCIDRYISRCVGGGASIQFIDKVVLPCGQRQILWETVEIPQVQFLDTVFAGCVHWHIDKAVDVPVISRLAPVRALH